MPYQPIENYGLIGDLHTVALVSMDGSIDWLCVPDFDSPSVFARLLDDRIGGYFQIAPTDPDHTCKQMYWPDTNVLVTRFFSQDGAGEVIDFMPVGEARQPEAQWRHHLIRRVTVVRGTLDMRLVCKPAFNYARDPHTAEHGPHGVRFLSAGGRLRLDSELPLHIDDGAAVGDFTLEEGQSATFVLSQMTDTDAGEILLTVAEAEALFRRTVQYWRDWLRHSTYTGRWREMVHRSALALKLMTYEPTGAIVAAPTCSLPEGIGGTRNWDYRYTWVRDSAFTVYAFLRLGFTKEAERFMHFMAQLCSRQAGHGTLQVMYGIDGRSELDEQTLDHLDGYRGSKPVRIGNGAYQQLQLDIYGEFLDAAYLYNKWGAPISHDLWQTLASLVDYVCESWQQPDEGVWETRGDRRHFVYSKLMCWVALDRGLRLADRRSFPCDRDRWQTARDAIYRDIMDKGWNPDRKAFTQSYESTALDAANLMMPLTLFLAPTDPRVIHTLNATLKSPRDGGLVADSLVYRYNTHEFDDGLAGHEGTFNICTFWLVEAITRAGRFKHDMLDDARLMFERMLGYANHLGLYAEETGPSGEALGNFPQAFTHLALISAAFNLDRALDARR